MAKPELLAPAGDMERLAMALAYARGGGVLKRLRGTPLPPALSSAVRTFCRYGSGNSCSTAKQSRGSFLISV